MPDMENALNEQKLVRRAIDGDKVALDQLLLAHYQHLADHLTPKVGTSAPGMISVDDVIQETFIHACRDIAKYQARESNTFLHWLRAIADNRLLDLLKTAKRKKRGGDMRQVQNRSDGRSSVVQIINMLSDQGRTPSRVAARGEAEAAMQVAIANLPDDQRQAIQLRFFQQKSLEEAAELMNRTPGSVRGLIHRAKQALRESMNRPSMWLTQR